MNRPLQVDIGKHVIVTAYGAPGTIIGLCDAQGSPVAEAEATDYMVHLDAPLSGIFGTVYGVTECNGQKGFGNLVPIPAVFVMADVDGILEAVEADGNEEIGEEAFAESDDEPEDFAA